MNFLSEHGLPTLVAVVSLGMVALAGGLLTDVGPWYERLRFPKLRPPNWLFGPAWTTIYIFIAVSGVMAWENAPDAAMRGLLITLFFLNALLNVLWTPLFFKFRRPDWALIEVAPLWLSIVALMVCIYAIRPGAALVMSPYLAWVSFAAWLNWRIVELNKPFGDAPAKRR
jgi:translocator protein